MFGFRQRKSGACRSYLIACEKTKQAALVDPLLQDLESCRALLKSEGLRLSCVIDTHTHADHLSAGTALRNDAPYLMHEQSQVATVTRRVSEGESLGVGGLKITFLHTPGHTQDSISLVLNDRLLSGDFLFSGPDGAGRLDFPGSDVLAHFSSLSKIEGLKDELLLFPAHEYRGVGGRTLGEERRANPVLLPRVREDYMRWWEQRRKKPEQWMGQMVEANLRGSCDPRAVLVPAQASACCAASEPTSAHENVPRISAQELAQKLKLAPKSVMLLDVRTIEEFNDDLGHIAGAVLIPIDFLPERLKEVPTGPVAVVCRSGKRALKAAEFLRSAGRGELWVLSGGMLAWNEAGLPVE